MNLLDLLFGHKRRIVRRRTKPITSSKKEVELLRKKAKEYLPKRIEELAKTHKLKYNKLRIKNVKTIWGSCSSKNNINLNLNLMKLRPELIDYVILHELCHTIEKNHSKKFWNLLEKHLPTAKVLRKELKRVRFS